MPIFTTKSKNERIPRPVPKSLVALIYFLLYYRLGKAYEHEKLSRTKEKHIELGRYGVGNITTFSMPKAILEKMLIRMLCDLCLTKNHRVGSGTFFIVKLVLPTLQELWSVVWGATFIPIGGSQFQNSQNFRMRG
ncbi:hypothetical protein BDC45DRAFT_539508 [Circinella umbellata]|nr:hypothetical protein BDC45DRAFT_539508 [Circinella umbellata]